MCGACREMCKHMCIVLCEKIESICSDMCNESDDILVHAIDEKDVEGEV